MPDPKETTIDPATIASIAKLAKERGASTNDVLRELVEEASDPAIKTISIAKRFAPRGSKQKPDRRSPPVILLEAKPITISEAKTQFSKLVARAQAGETITIAHGNEPAAQLVPMPVMDRTPGLFADRVSREEVDAAVRFFRGEGREDEFAAAEGGTLRASSGQADKAGA